VLLSADVTIYLVTPRMAHSLRLGEVAAVLAFADRRNVVGNLLNPAGPDLVQSRVSYVPDGD